MELLPIQDLVHMPTTEVEEVVRMSLPHGWGLHLFFDQIWQATLEGPSETPEWSGVGADRRTLLFDVYGVILRSAGAKPKHPMWQRRSEVVIPQQYGERSYQGDVRVDEPEDLNPTEIEQLYGLRGKRL